MSKYLHMVLVILCIIVGSCFNEGALVDGLSPYDTSTIEGEWRLEALESVGGMLILLDHEDTIWISFSDSGRVLGGSQGLCGNYFKATFSNDSAIGLHIDSLSSTEALCPSSSYWQFINALRSVSRFSFIDRLYLYYNNETKRLWLSRCTKFTLQ